MEIFILLYLFAAIATTVLYGARCRCNTPDNAETAICFFLWWLVLSLMRAYNAAALGVFIRNKCSKNRG